MSNHANKIVLMVSFQLFTFTEVCKNILEIYITLTVFQLTNEILNYRRMSVDKGQLLTSAVCV